MSTERRGMSRTKRLNALSPLSAKQSSCATRGIVWTTRAACRRYSSSSGIEVLRHSDMVSGIEFAAARENALACTKIDAFSIDLFEPGMIVTLGKPEEETLHL